MAAALAHNLVPLPLRDVKTTDAPLEQLIAPGSRVSGAGLCDRGGGGQSDRCRGGQADRMD